MNYRKQQYTKRDHMYFKENYDYLEQGGLFGLILLSPQTPLSSHTYMTMENSKSSANSKKRHAFNSVIRCPLHRLRCALD